MDRGTWQASVHGVTESDMTERLTLSLSLGKSSTIPVSQLLHVQNGETTVQSVLL